MEAYQKTLENVLEILKKHPEGSTTLDISREIKLNRNSVTKYLHVLLASGRVSQRKVGPAKIYTIAKSVPLTSMLEVTQDGVLVLDKNMFILQANNALLDMFKIKREDIIGKGLPSTPFASLDRKHGESRFTHKNTTYAIKIIPATLMNGNPGYFLLIEDITEKTKILQHCEEAEALYKALSDASFDAIILHDKGKVIGINQAYTDLFGYTQKDIKGKQALDFMSPEEQKKVRKHIEEGNTAPFSTKITHKNGSLITVTVKGKNIRYKKKMIRVAVLRQNI